MSESTSSTIAFTPRQMISEAVNQLVSEQDEGGLKEKLCRSNAISAARESLRQLELMEETSQNDV